MGTVALAAAVVVSGALRLVGDGACPAPAAVAAELAPLLPPSTPASTVELREEASGLRVRQLDDSGHELHGRLLPHAACSALAVGAAVVIGGWARAPVTAIGPQHLTLPRREAVEPVRASRPAATLVSDEEATADRHAGSAALDLSVAVSGAFSGSDSAAPGGMLEISLQGPRGCLGGQLALAGHGLRHQPLAEGSVAWTRAVASLGVRCVVEAAPVQLTFHVAAQGGLLYLAGQGFRDSEREIGGDVGAAAGVRMSWRWNRLAPFAGIGGGAWFTRQVAVLRDGRSAAEVPQFEVLLLAGLSLRVF